MLYAEIWYNEGVIMPPLAARMAFYPLGLQGLTLSDAASKNPRKAIIIKITYFIFSHNENTFVSQVLSHEMFV